MKILDYCLEAYVTYNCDSMEKTLHMLEDAVNYITDSHSARFKLKSAIHELMVNSLEHGYKKSEGPIHIKLSKKDNSIFFEICDQGLGLDSSCLNFDIKNSKLSSLNSRGWGLFIINNLFDSMKISPNKPKGTKITLTLCL